MTYRPSISIPFKFLCFWVSIVCAIACSDDSTPNDNSNTDDEIERLSPLYFPIRPNELMKFDVSFTVDDFDEAGTLVSRESIDNHRLSASFGLETPFGGRPMFPLFAFDADGEPLKNGRPSAYFGREDGATIGMNFEGRGGPGMILPAQFPDDLTWLFVPQPVTANGHGIELDAEWLGQWTNTLDIVYSDVLKVNVRYSDSTNIIRVFPYEWLGFRTQKGSGAVYFARNHGPVGAELHEFESLVKYQEFGGGEPDFFERYTVSGSAVRRQ